MSQLFLANNQANWRLNVVAFSSPISSMMQTVQTKKMAHHFPIRYVQSQIQFTVQFPSEQEFEQFQRFVRSHQQQALLNTKLLWMNWPERDIDNFTGVIKSFRAGGMRYNFAPRASFVVDLVDSLAAHRTELASLPQLLWRTIYGAGMGPDAVLGPPSALENSMYYSPQGPVFGQQTLSGANEAPTFNPAQPGLGPAGIASGS